MRLRHKTSLPTIEELLTSGGDARIALGANGTNKYGCFPTPQPDILAYGSCTASTISVKAFAASTALYERLETTSYAEEMQRIREELSALYGLQNVDIIFGASGTGLHSFAAQFLHRDSLFIIMPDASETGSGVPEALQGHNIQTIAIKNRLENGDLRDAASVDAEVETLVKNAAEAGQHILLILTDVSKTGLIIPSPASILALKRRYPDMLDVLVDGCQFRLSSSTLRAYLDQDFMVAITGSKFVTGPAFSGALLVPERVAKRLRKCTLPPALSEYSTQADWPQTWAACANLPDIANYGLLLRWEAALAELRVFCTLPEKDIATFLENFAASIQKRLSDDPIFEPLPTREISRHSFTNWDNIPTIFPFRMRHAESENLLNKNEITGIYERMKTERCQLGQPVACGALRLCVDMRLIVDALTGRGADAIIAEALHVLDILANV